MKITNKMGLPEAVVKAIYNDNYTPGKSDITCTAIIGPPRIRQLHIRHGNEIVTDASDRIWALVGQVGHAILERAELEDEITEDRLYMNVHGWVLGGQFDNLHLFNHTLTDYKFTSYYAVKDGMKDDWESQLNILSTLCIENGHTVENIQIVAILKDWSRAESKRNSDYPQTPVVIIKGKLWDAEKRAGYISHRVLLHQQARDLSDNELIPCTDEERWCIKGKVAVIREGNKRAAKLFDKEEEAERYKEEKNEKLKKGAKPFILEVRPTTYNRCEDYCDVNKWCNQYQSEKDEENNN